MIVNRKISVIYIAIIIAGYFIYSKISANLIPTPSPQKIEKEDQHQEKRIVNFKDDKLQNLTIKTFKIGQLDHQKRLSFPGQVTLNENEVIHVVASIPGIVTKVYKNLGEEVKAGEPLALIESREMAEAKSAYISAYKDLALKKDLLGREEKLWKIKVKAETEFLKTRTAYETSKIDLEQKKQKLLALRVKASEIDKLPDQDASLNLYTIEVPIEGKILERHTSLGEVINSDRQLFVIANLNKVWVKLSIPSLDLPDVQKGQVVDLYKPNATVPLSARVMYVSPVISEENRTGQAIIEVDNTQGVWHPGDFISAQVIIAEKTSFLSIPASAVQKIKGEPYVFLKVAPNQFEAKKILLHGSENEKFLQVKEGLKIGDEIAMNDTFLLKAEFGKSEAEHAH